MNATQKIQYAKMEIILKHPFFATFLLHLPFICDPGIPTANTNGKNIRYNPAFVANLPVNQVVSLIIHEILHVTLLHHTRRGYRSSVKWNIAADYAINPIIKDYGFILPPDGLFNNCFIDKNAEAIYDRLPDSEDNSCFVSFGEVVDLPFDANIQEVESEVKQLMVQAMQIATRQGRLPDKLRRAISEIVEPRVSWQQALAHFLTHVSRNDYTWRKPSPRYLYAGLYLPILENPEIGKIILIVDTSGSIRHKLINQFATEIQQITSFIKVSITVIYVDAAVQGVQEIDPNEQVQLHPVGGGGTNFQPGFNYIDTHCLNPAVVIYLTDGACDDFPTEPAYVTLWAKFGDAPFNPPFGNVISID